MSATKRGCVAVTLCFSVTIGVMSAAVALGAERPDITPMLKAGKLADIESLLTEHLKGSPKDSLSGFQLGAIQVFRAVERLSQDGVKYGALNQALAVPFLRIGGFSSGKRDPQPVSYQDLRNMVSDFQARISAAEKTLATASETADGTLVWDLNFADVKIDFDGDDQFRKSENLFALYRFIAHQGAPIKSKEIRPRLDLGDLYWLRGYCHLLCAMADFVLTYDEKRLFDLTAHTFFANPQTEFALRRTNNAESQEQGWGSLGDFIAVIHLMTFKLREPERLQLAQQHLLQMIEMSRQSWKAIEAETDNDREWMPGAEQKSVIEGLEINRERIKTWQRFLEEAEDVVTGKKLVPFWRNGFEDGVNFGKFFTKPADFDLVLWVQGTAALPYLEKGEKSSPETWQEFQRVFRGEFIGFAAWIN